jgi:hypothetical protein
MGVVAKILSITRVLRNGAYITDVKSDPGGGANVTAEHFSSPGDDSHPLNSDYAALGVAMGTGRRSALGYVDPINEPQSEEGDKRIYSRSPETALHVAHVWLKKDATIEASNENGSIFLLPDGGSIVTTQGCSFSINSDGSIVGSNGSGSFELNVGGSFVVNGVEIDPDGNITTPGTLNADSITSDDQNITLSTHTHNSGTTPSPDPGS